MGGLYAYDIHPSARQPQITSSGPSRVYIAVWHEDRCQMHFLACPRNNWYLLANKPLEFVNIAIDQNQQFEPNISYL